MVTFNDRLSQALDSEESGLHIGRQRRHKKINGGSGWMKLLLMLTFLGSRGLVLVQLTSANPVILTQSMVMKAKLGILASDTLAAVERGTDLVTKTPFRHSTYSRCPPCRLPPWQLPGRLTMPPQLTAVALGARLHCPSVPRSPWTELCWTWRGANNILLLPLSPLYTDIVPARLRTVH